MPGLFINNEFVPAKAGSTLESINPFDETVIAKVAAGGEEDIDAAVAAARAAFKASEWRKISAAERGALLWKLGDLCEKNAHILATVDAWDNGKPYQQALDEDIAETISVFRYYAGWADKVYGQTIETSDAKLAYTKHEPLGMSQSQPSAFPSLTSNRRLWPNHTMELSNHGRSCSHLTSLKRADCSQMAAWKLGPALACGNTVVLKPAEQTPLGALFLATLIKEAGFPAGVVNIVNGHGKDAGSRLSAHPNVDKIAFTGSTITGRNIMKAAAGNLKNITLSPACTRIAHTAPAHVRYRFACSHRMGCRNASPVSC